MNYLPRHLEAKIRHALNRGKSILLLGPRQVGKTSLIKELIQPDISYTFASPTTRLRYETDITLLEQELLSKTRNSTTPPIVFIDEVQKIPLTMDIAQHLIDQKKAQFILTGSSARKLKHGPHVNLLPGRVTLLLMDALSLQELPHDYLSLDNLLFFGSLPNIVTETDIENKESDLQSYVNTYIEEEIRTEALVRNVGHFSRFLQLAASESGNIVNFTRLSQDIGVAASTIANYYQILEDCLIVFRIDPIIHTQSQRRLIKAPKYLFFDLGVRRIAAQEGLRPPLTMKSHFFEQLIGIELIKLTHLNAATFKICYWRDANGPEIDFVAVIHSQYIPIEVKWTDKPKMKDARHLQKFLREYENTEKGYIVCRTPHRLQLTDNIEAIPWQEIHSIIPNS